MMWSLHDRCSGAYLRTSLISHHSREQHPAMSGRLVCGRLRTATTLALLVIRGQDVQGAWSTGRPVGPSVRKTVVSASGVRQNNGSRSTHAGSCARSPWAKMSSDADSSRSGDEGTGMRGKIGVGARLTALGLGGTAVAAKVAARPLPVVLVHGILDCVENM